MCQETAPAAHCSQRTSTTCSLSCCSCVHDVSGLLCVYKCYGDKWKCWLADMSTRTKTNVGRTVSFWRTKMYTEIGLLRPAIFVPEWLCFWGGSASWSARVAFVAVSSRFRMPNKSNAPHSFAIRNTSLSLWLQRFVSLHLITSYRVNRTHPSGMHTDCGVCRSVDFFSWGPTNCSSQISIRQNRESSVSSYKKKEKKNLICLWCCFRRCSFVCPPHICMRPQLPPPALLGYLAKWKAASQLRIFTTLWKATAAIFTKSFYGGIVKWLG